MSPPVVSLRGVDFAYGAEPVLEGIDLEVQEREFLAVVGPNAGGKSTLLRLIAGLLRPARGRIEVLGGPPQRTRHLLGYVAQHPGFVRDFPIRVRQVVELGLLGRTARGGLLSTLRPWRPNEEERARIDRALAEVGAEALAERPVGSLSGGQLQRVLLARALVSAPRLLLLDEPTAALDPRTETGIFSLLERLNRRMTIIVVSHDLDFVERHAGRIVQVERTLRPLAPRTAREAST